MKVSVIIPVYNMEKYLVECLDSICNQTLKEIEIILVNDESTDNSLKILKEYEKKDHRIIVVNNIHQGGGAGSARNAGLAIATGEYLSILDSDDYFDLKLLEKTYKKAIACSADIVYYDAEIFNNNTKSTLHSLTKRNDLFPLKEVFNWEDFPEIFLFPFHTVAWRYLFSRELINDYELCFQTIPLVDDAYFVKVALMCAKRITLLNEPLVYYRKNHNESQSTFGYKSAISAPKAFLEIKVKLEELNIFKEVQNGFTINIIEMCQFYFSNCQDMESFNNLFNVLQKEYIKSLELERSVTNNLLNIDIDKWISQIKNGDMESFIFDMILNNTKKKFHFETEFLFPNNLVEKDDNIILYGAGTVGIGFFIQNLQHKYCNIIDWVDKNATENQYHINNLETLKSRQLECDKVIVAIDDIYIFEIVKLYLIEIGYKDTEIINGVK